MLNNITIIELLVVYNLWVPTAEWIYKFTVYIKLLYIIMYYKCMSRVYICIQTHWSYSKDIMQLYYVYKPVPVVNHTIERRTAAVSQCSFWVIKRTTYYNILSAMTVCRGNDMGNNTRVQWTVLLKRGKRVWAANNKWSTWPAQYRGPCGSRTKFTWVR